MVAQPLLAAGADPDPPLFGSFRSMNPRPIHFSIPTNSDQNPNASAGSSSVKTVDPPSGSDKRQSGFRPHGRSYSEVVKPVTSKSGPKHDLHLFGKVKPHPGVRSSLRDGAKVISISSAVNHVLSEPFKFAVVGKFSHGVPKFNQIGKFFASLNLNGKFQMHWLSPRQIMVILSEETDFVRVWLGKIWQVAGFPMRVIKWSSSYDTKVESPIVPVWVRLPELPVHFFDRVLLFEIASNVGKPIRVDSATASRSKLSEARFCVELNLLLPRVDFLFLEFDGIMRKQRVVYENLPVFCSFCSRVGHGADACYRTNHDLKPTLQDKVVKQSNEVDGCAVWGALSVVQSEVVMPAPFQNLQLIKMSLDFVHGAIQPTFKWPALNSGVLGFKINYKGDVLLTQFKSNCVITELEEGEIIEDGEGDVDAKVGHGYGFVNGGAGAVGFHSPREVFILHATGTFLSGKDKTVSVLHINREEAKEKAGEGKMALIPVQTMYDALNVVVMESVAGAKTVNSNLVIPEMVLSGFADSLSGLHAPVHAHFSGSDSLHLKDGVDDVRGPVHACTENSALARNNAVDVVSSTVGERSSSATEDLHGDFGNFLVYEQSADVMVPELVENEVMADAGSHAAMVESHVTSHALVCSDVTTFIASESAAVVGEGVGSRAEVVVTDVITPTSDVMRADQDDDFMGSGILGGPRSQSIGPVNGRMDGPVGPANISQQNGSAFTGEINEAAKTLNEATIIPQQKGLQLDRLVHRGKINEGTKTSKPFVLFKDKRQLDKIDGIPGSGILRKPVRNVPVNVHRTKSEGVKTPLQLAQEELAKGGAFHDFVITDSHTSKKFSNMDFMARRSWADEMEDDVD